MRDTLLRWFESERRPLPWRDGRRDPYRTLVVEAMSQQTRIDTVAARLPAFLARFPDLRTLAAADLDAVLHAWAGLGYYRRARALHALARAVVAEHGGALPGTPEALRRLPGVGPYTAAAIAAQAFGVPGVAVDGNVRRVGARWLADPDADERRVRAALEEALLGQEPPAEAAGVAEALVELGATVCTPRAPACGRCPLQPGCAAAAAGDPERYPRPRKRAPARPWPLHAWLAVRRSGKVLEVAVERRGDDAGPWAGLVGPPWRERAPLGARPLGRFVHRLSHRRVEATVWATAAPPEDAAARWVATAELGDLGAAEVDRRALAWWVDHPEAVERTPDP